jgi:hypothetical protein
MKAMISYLVLIILILLFSSAAGDQIRINEQLNQSHLKSVVSSQATLVSSVLAVQGSVNR